MINVNANVTGAASAIRDTLGGSSLSPTANKLVPEGSEADGKHSGFAKTIKAVEKYISQVDDLQQSSDMSIKDFMTGKNEDITSLVSAVAKADMSFKLLVGVRNKLIEAYKQTMNMPL
jgi:flagellar hook-basal body complex protein FliE